MRQFDRAEAIPEGSRLLHIGPAKTGTTTLQGALHTCREAMAEHDVMYAGSTRHSRTAMVGAAYTKVPEGYPSNAKRRWKNLAREVRNSDAKRIVISSEILARLSRERARLLLEDVGGTTQLVLTMRPLAHILASRWQQSVQDEMSQSYSDWLHDLFETTPEAIGKPAFWLRYDLARHLRRWGPLIGEENITFVVLDPANRGMLLESFEDLLALPTGTLKPDASLTNPSLGHPEVEMLASFNRAYLSDGHGRAEFIRAIRGKALVDVKSDPATLAARRIKTPRWAVSRANETAEGWIAAVQASDARVVGQLEHLLVDPDEYDENPVPPTELSTETAGQLAFQFYRAGLQYGERQGRAELKAELAEQAEADRRQATPNDSLTRVWRQKIADRVQPPRR